MESSDRNGILSSLAVKATEHHNEANEEWEPMKNLPNGNLIKQKTVTMI